MTNSPNPAAAPVIETQRLRLRGHHLNDFEQLHANWSDPMVYKFTSGRASTREESWNRLMRYFGYWPALGFGFWVLEEKHSGKMLGEIGMAEFHRDIAEVPDGFPEFGWVLGTAAHGKGYASEALTAIMAWADATLKAPSTFCIIDPKNIASQKLAQKFGFMQIAECLYHDMPSLVFRRDRK
ncbi:MAG: GNAT family N-acetyltransferase [Alphaproteobacteria bacterium]|nr:GNAT family N-acetyltransferase [Alphaproteobacteria bacterium]